MIRIYAFNNKLPLIIVPATLAGISKKTIRLALDTGATNVVIPWEVALNIGCRPSEATQWVRVTLTGRNEFAPKVVIPSFECLGVRLRNFSVVCHNLPANVPIDGLLGASFLKRFEIKINYPEGYLIITDEFIK